MLCLNCSREIPENALYCPWCGRKQLREKRKEIRVPKPRLLPSGKWYIYMMVDGVNYPVEADTEAECVTRARAIKTGLIEAEKADNQTVGTKIDEYIKDRENVLSPSTVKGYKKIRKYQLQALMPLRSSAVTDSVVQRSINSDAKEYSAKTIRNAYGLLTAALGRTFDVHLPQQAPKSPEVLSSDQIRDFLSSLSGTGELECAALLAMWLSLRRSEIAALKWEDVGEHTITVRSALVDGEYGLVEKPTKTKKSTRIIPCPSYILDRINALPRSSERVFTQHPNAYWRQLDKLCREKGLPHIYLHGLRHTNASVMALLSIDPKYANKRGGWSSDYIRQNVYTQVMTEGELAAASKIDQYFEALIPDSK